MTEKSYLWDGTVTGDSTLAPYYAETFNQYMHLHLGNDILYVIPGYLDDLEPLYNTSSPYSLTMRPGAALLKNFLYVQDEKESFSLSAVAAGYYRIDALVLRADYNKQRVELVVKEGSLQTTIASALTGRASLTQIGGFLWEEGIVYVLLDGDEIFNYISDQRHFIVNFESLLKINPLNNSEFLTYSNGAVSQGPESWDNVDGTALSGATLRSTQARGRGIQFSQNQGIGQTLQVTTGTNKTFTLSVINTGITPLILRLRGYLTSGATTDWHSGFGVSYFGDISKITHRFTEEITAIEAQVFYPFTGNGIVGQCLLKESYHTGINQLDIDRLIVYQDDETDANWSNTAKSSGNTTIDLTASFSNEIKAGTKAIILMLEGRDSASAAGGGIYMLGRSLKTEGYMTIDAVPNDEKRSLTMLVPVSYQIFNTSSGVPQFEIAVAASGAGTFDATARIVGVIT